MKDLCWKRFFLYLAVLTVFTSPVLQADVTGSIFGTVSDPTGAAVSAAQVTLSNPDTGLSRKTVTDSIGSYQFGQLVLSKSLSLACSGRLLEADRRRVEGWSRSTARQRPCYHRWTGQRCSR